MSSHLIPGRVSCRAGGQAGFTLMELMVVTAILGLIAYVALDTVAQDLSPVRFDDTRTRLVSIRNAVLGSPAAGQAQGSTGFIADMGGVPDSPQELMTMPTGVQPWRPDINWSVSPPIGTGLGAGWRGPYLHAFREKCIDYSLLTPCTGTSAGQLALRDGWGNIKFGEQFDDNGAPVGNLVDLFGWRRFGPDTKGNLYVQSYGVDGAPDSAATPEEFAAQDQYTRDYPPAAPPSGSTTVSIGSLPDPLVAARDYQISLPALLSIQLTNASSVPIGFSPNTHVCASLHYVTNGVIAAVFTSVDATALPTTLDQGGGATVNLTVPAISATTPPQPWLPAGALAVRLRRVIASSVTADTTCGTSASAAPLLEHTYDITAGRCASDTNNLLLSPGLACGTSFITIVPPSLPQQINVNLVWPLPSM